MTIKVPHGRLDFRELTRVGLVAGHCFRQLVRCRSLRMRRPGMAPQVRCSNRCLSYGLAFCFAVGLLYFVKDLCLAADNPTELYSLSEKVRFITENSSKNCQHIHIALPCYSEESRQNLSVFVKSLLYHSRSSIVHLHIITHSQGCAILGRLFATWDLPMVKVHFYEIKKERRHDLLIHTTQVMLSHPHRYFTKVSDINELYVVLPEVILLKDIILFPDIIGKKIHNKNVVAISSSTSENVEQSSCMLYIGQNGVSSRGEGFQHLKISNIPHLVLDEVLLWDNRIYNPEIGTHILELDGDLFRTVAHPCVQVSNSNLKENVNKPCYEFTLHALVLRRTHLYFHTTSPMSSEGPDSVSLLTTLQLNRMDGLERLLKAWEGPVHVVIYLADEEIPQFVYRIKNSDVIPTREQVAFHVVYKRLKKHYPINYLRNIALNEVKTPYLIMLDVDFVPNPNLAQTALAAKKKYFPNKDVALIVPAFETHLVDYKVPSSKSVMLQELHDKQVIPYHDDAAWKVGHVYTDYKKWYGAAEPYKVIGQFGYEPYMVLATDKAPKYSEILLERMRDKLPYTIEIEESGTEMYVLHDAYAVHLPHPKSLGYKNADSSTFQSCRNKIYNNEVARIKKKYSMLDNSPVGVPVEAEVNKSRQLS